jgi:hypothetical protein
MGRLFTKLEYERLRAGYPTQQALAEAVSCDRTGVSRIESGAAPKWSRAAVMIALHLGLNPDTLAEPADIRPEARAELRRLARDSEAVAA